MTEAVLRRRSSRQPKAIGGWLIVVSVFLVIAPLVILVANVQTYVPLFSNGSWELLTTPGTGTYHRLWAPVLLTELFVNIGFFAAFLLLILTFITRSRRFPQLCIWVLALHVAVLFVDLLLLDALGAERNGADSVFKQLLPGLLPAAILIPYMLRSQRVRSTFIT